MSLPSFLPYEGPLDRKKMSKNQRLAYEAYNGAKARSKMAGYPPPSMTAREFIGWWLHNLKLFKGTVPSVARIDHSKGYSFDNFIMQDMAENSREGVLRNKNNISQQIKTGKKIKVLCKNSGEVIAVIPSIRSAAELFGVSQRLIQFLVRGKYKSTSKINFNLMAV